MRVGRRQQSLSADTNVLERTILQPLFRTHLSETLQLWKGREALTSQPSCGGVSIGGCISGS
jgi:hypothetical protein